PAWLWIEALPVFAYSVLKLLVTGGLPEIRRRAAHIMDIPFEVRILGHLYCLVKKGLMAPGLQDPSLVEGQRTEAASSKASAVADEAELYFRDCRHASVLLIRGMIGPHIGIAIDLIHFLLAKGSGRRVLDHVEMFSIGLCQTSSLDRVCIAVLGIK